MTERKPIDWERIEAEYRAGQLSVREIARQHGVGAPAIVKRAQKLGWERDLSASVREAVNAKLVKETAAGNTEGNTRNTRETVEAAADRVVSLVRQHRADFRRDGERLVRLAEKLDGMMDEIVSLKDLEMATGIQESIGRTRHKLVALERQAFGLANNAAPDDEGDKKGSNSIKLEFVTAQVPPGG